MFNSVFLVGDKPNLLKKPISKLIVTLVSVGSALLPTKHFASTVTFSYLISIVGTRIPTLSQNLSLLVPEIPL